MGGSQSLFKSVSPQFRQLLTEVQSNIEVSVKSTCESSSGNSQTINISSIDLDGCKLEVGDVFQGIESRISSNCMLTDGFDKTLESAITQSMAQTAVANPDTAALAANVTNILKTNVNFSKVAQCMARSFNSQMLNISNIKVRNCPPGGYVKFGDLTQQISSDSALSCILTASPLKVTEDLILAAKANNASTDTPTDSTKTTGVLTAGEIAAVVLSLLAVIILVFVGLWFRTRRTAGA